MPTSTPRAVGDSLSRFIRSARAAELVNHVLRLTGSVQSLTPAVMDSIQRSNMSSDQLMQLALEAEQKDVSSRCELILSLPGETSRIAFREHRSDRRGRFLPRDHVPARHELPGSEMFLPENRKKFAMKGRFRVMADCIGSYELSGERIIAAELEEICLETSTISFDDYVARLPRGRILRPPQARRQRALEGCSTTARTAWSARCLTPCEAIHRLVS